MLPETTPTGPTAADAPADSLQFSFVDGTESTEQATDPADAWDHYRNEPLPTEPSPTRKPEQQESRTTVPQIQPRQAENERLRQLQDNARAIFDELGVLRQSGTPKNEDLDPLDFATETEYYAAIARQAAREALAQSNTARAEQLERQAATAAQNVFEARSRDFAASTKDYAAVAYSDKVPYSDTMLDVVRASPVGPQLAYHLGKNPGVAETISRLPEYEQVYRLGELAGSLNNLQPKRTSQAPAPPRRVRAQASSSTSPQDMNYDQFGEWMKSVGAL